jgi:hypothetical protein
MGNHDIAHEVRDTLDRWVVERQAEEERRRLLTATGQAALHRWKTQGSHSDDDDQFVSSQIKIVIATLNESTSLGKLNNEAFETLTRDFINAKKLKSEIGLAKMTQIRDRSLEIVGREPKARSSVLDKYENEVQILDLFVVERLGPVENAVPPRKFWRK